METVTISKEEYEHLKRLEKIAQEDLIRSVRRGFKDAVEGKVRER